MIHPYATMAFAKSLAHWGKAEFVPQWNTPVILRNIEGGGVDAAGVYPLCALPADADIAGGLSHLRALGCVSVILVLDDIHRPAQETLQKHFNHFIPFKKHFLYRPALGPISYHSQHKRALKKAVGQVRVEALDLHKHAGAWQLLYDHLTAQLQLSGLHAFPLAHAEALANIEGVTAIGAWMGDELVSAHIWAGDGKTQHSHLVASNERGYGARAGFGGKFRKRRRRPRPLQARICER